MRKYPQINVRLSPELLKALRDEAKSEGRTLTAQVVFILKYYLGGLGLLPKEKDEK